MATARTITLDDPGQAFARGFLARAGPAGLAARSGWDPLRVGATEFLIHPTLPKYSYTGADGGTVALFGECIDLEACETNSSSIGRRIAKKYSSGGIACATEYVAYLGGRFVCFIGSNTKLHVIPDCHASQSIFWHPSEDEIFISSHVALVAEVMELPTDDEVLDLMRRAKEMKTGGTRYLPGARTSFKDVHPLLPNHRLDIDLHSNVVRHERFYPSASLRPSDDPAAVRDFPRLFKRHAALLCTFGYVGISLTAGWDSRATLFASLGQLPPDSFTWTWNNFSDPNPDIINDVLEANRLSFQVGLRHRVVSINPLDSDHPFAKTYARTFHHTAQHPRAAFAMGTQLPNDFYQFLSMLAETGTGFYKRRTQDHFDAARLSRLYSSFPFGELPEVIAAHRRFMEYGNFYPETIEGVDYHDLFYWEARAGRWAALRVQEADLSHRVLLPFNQRAIVESLLSVPIEERREKQPLREFIASLNAPKGAVSR